MNLTTFKKYQVRKTGACAACYGSERRLHYAQHLRRAIGAEWYGPCFACQWVQFQATLRGQFPHLDLVPVFTGYARTREYNLRHGL